MYENLKKLIKEKGISQENYAKHIYIDRSGWFAKTTGRRRWQPFEIETIKKELGYDLTERND